MTWFKDTARRKSIDLDAFHRWFKKRLPSAAATHRGRLWHRYQRLLERAEAIEIRMELLGCPAKGRREWAGYVARRARAVAFRREARATMHKLMAAFKGR